MSGTMMIGGQSEGMVRRADVQLAPGLGYWRDALIDTYLNARGRVSRIMAKHAHNPQVLGIGIDVDTALELEHGERFTVLGRGAVIIFDGRVSHPNVADVGEDEVLALTDTRVHVIPQGYGFNLKTKRPLLPGGEVEPTPE